MDKRKVPRFYCLILYMLMQGNKSTRTMQGCWTPRLVPITLATADS